MSKTSMTHFSDDELMAHALERPREDITEHVKTCRQCARYVEDIRSIENDIRGLPEEDVPERVSRKILTDARRKNQPEKKPFGFMWRGSFPFLVGLAVIAAALFLYFLFVYLH